MNGNGNGNVIKHTLTHRKRTEEDSSFSIFSCVTAIKSTNKPANQPTNQPGIHAYAHTPEDSYKMKRSGFICACVSAVCLSMNIIKLHIYYTQKGFIFTLEHTIHFHNMSTVLYLTIPCTFALLLSVHWALEPPTHTHTQRTQAPIKTFHGMSHS